LWHDVCRAVWHDLCRGLWHGLCRSPPPHKVGLARSLRAVLAWILPTPPPLHLDALRPAATPTSSFPGTHLALTFLQLRRHSQNGWAGGEMHSDNCGDALRRPGRCSLTAGGMLTDFRPDAPSLIPPSTSSIPPLHPHLSFLCPFMSFLCSGDGSLRLLTL